MNKITKVKIHIVKELFKLPCDKKTSTIKTTDLFRLVENISKTIPDKDVEQYLKNIKQ